MSQLNGPDQSAFEPQSDACSRCGRQAAWIPLLYVGKDHNGYDSQKVICDSCLKSRSRRKKTWAFLGGVAWLIDYGGFFFWVGSLIVVAIVAALVGSSGKR
jgi:hypothetical protein